MRQQQKLEKKHDFSLQNHFTATYRNLPDFSNKLESGCHHFFILSSKVLLSSLARFFNWFALKLSGIDSLQIHARREIKINILKLRQRWPQTRLEREGSERRLQDDFRNQWGIHQFSYSPVTSRQKKKISTPFLSLMLSWIHGTAAYLARNRFFATLKMSLRLFHEVRTLLRITKMHCFLVFISHKVAKSGMKLPQSGRKSPFWSMGT